MTPEPILTEQGLREVMCEIDTRILNCEKVKKESLLGTDDRVIASSRIAAYEECKSIIINRMI